MIKAKQKESKREKVPSGTHIARCYEMIHIGTVTWEYLGEVKETDKVRLTFELPAEMRQFNEEEMQPMVISKEYTLSMHEKANLRIDAPAQINPNSILDYNENWSAEKFESLPDWIKDQMKMTPEYEQVSQEDSSEISAEQFELATKLGYDSDVAPF